MGVLPTSRIESHGSNSPIKPTTIDGIQDAIIGSKKSGAFPRQIPPRFHLLSGTWNWNTVTTLYIVSSGASSLIIPLDIEKGETIRSVQVNVFGDGAADAVYTLRKTSNAQAITTLCTGTDTNRSAAWATLDISSLGAFTTSLFADYETLSLQIDANASNYRIGMIRWVTDRL